MFQDRAKSQKTVFQQWNGSWNYAFADRLREVELNLSGDTAYYIYDSTGNRCRKVVVKGSIREERYYLEGYEVFRKFVSGDLDFERQTLHVSDDTKKFATLETKTWENATPVNPIVADIRYQYDNHLGSACLELDQNAQIISYEEYHPFGTTSYRSGRTETEVSLKRYKYVGKEKDEETGLHYHVNRYYAPWIARWISVDPMSDKYPHQSPFMFCSGNPVVRIDMDGMEDEVFIVIKNESSDTRLNQLKNASEITNYLYNSGLGKDLIDKYIDNDKQDLYITFGNTKIENAVGTTLENTNLKNVEGTNLGVIDETNNKSAETLKNFNGLVVNSNKQNTLITLDQSLFSGDGKNNRSGAKILGHEIGAHASGLGHEKWGQAGQDDTPAKNSPAKQLEKQINFLEFKAKNGPLRYQNNYNSTYKLTR